MSDNAVRLDFFRKLLQGLHISSCLVENPERCIPFEIDLGLRKSLYGVDNYAVFLDNDILQAQSKTIYCFFDAYSCKYIFLRLPHAHTQTYLFIGPYMLEPPSQKELAKKATAMDLTPRQQQILEQHCASLPILEDEGWLLTMVKTLCASLWGSAQYTLEYVDYMIPDHFKPVDSESHARNVNEPELNLRALEANYANEKLLMDAVSKGQLHLLTAAATVYNNGAQPRLADTLKDRKNNLIILKTLLRKAAEYGGVHPLHIHRLSAQFADQIENIRTMKQSLRLQEEMIRSFCLLVKHQSLSRYSYYVGQVITLVQYDLTADLRLKTIAEKLNVNASYLSDLFHREYGCTLTAFITRERINHGTHLLQSTNKPIGQIAAECGIQDTAYFIKLFRKHTGRTPSMYRKEAGQAPS